MSFNHKGSCAEMEAVAAASIFSRSINSRQLKYATFVGDSDRSCFGRVKEAMFAKYGDTYEITKEECVGHVQETWIANKLTLNKSKTEFMLRAMLIIYANLCSRQKLRTFDKSPSLVLDGAPLKSIKYQISRSDH